MNDCPLIQLDNGKWHCPVCDPHKKRLLPVKARRNCRPGGRPYGKQAGELVDMIEQFDALMESGDDDAADKLAERILCVESRKRKKKGCGCGKNKP